MKAIFLGTGTSQGVPVIACKCPVCQSDDPRDKRLRSSVLIQYNQKNYVIDCGPDFRQQMLRENVGDIRAIIFTHAHKDHTGGLDDIRAFNYILRKVIDVYANQITWDAIKSQYSYIFEKGDYPGLPLINEHLITNEPFEIDDARFIPVETLHYKLPVFGYRIGNFTYITDANYIPEPELEKIEGTEILVLNALRKEKHISHFNLQEAIQLIERIKPRKAYLTHISHQMGLHEEVNQSLPDGVELAYDGLSLEI